MYYTQFWYFINCVLLLWSSCRLPHNKLCLLQLVTVMSLWCQKGGRLVELRPVGHSAGFSPVRRLQRTSCLSTCPGMCLSTRHLSIYLSRSLSSHLSLDRVMIMVIPLSPLRLYLVILEGLQVREGVCPPVLASILLNSTCLFCCDLRGVNLLLPSFISALESVLLDRYKYCKYYNHCGY